MKTLRSKLIVSVAALAAVLAVGILAGLGAAGAFDTSAVTAETEPLADSSFLTQASADRAGFASLRDVIPPLLNPDGVQLVTNELSPGVHALLSEDIAVDNSGFVVGEQGVLVIDAHINHAMAQNIQDAVRRVTDKPIVYLVNTNYHGDHTFGNYAFPAETQIIAHRETARRMVDFEN